MTVEALKLHISSEISRLKNFKSKSYSRLSIAKRGKIIDEIERLENMLEYLNNIEFNIEIESNINN